MAIRRDFTLVVPNSGRSISDYAWQTVEPQFVDAWKSATVCLRNRHVLVGTEHHTVTIDWTSVLRRQERHYATMRYIHNRDGTISSDRILKAKFPRRPSRTLIRVTATSEAASHPLSVAESVINDVFLIMNIAAPGCCDFYKATLLGDKIEPDISLSSFYFEDALYVGLKNKWPVFHFMEIEQVASWFDTVRQRALQIPQNPMERVLFALLHMAKISLSPMIVIWLFYAFESLLQTKAGENFSSIVNRLCLLLEPDNTQSSVIKKRMRELYDIRSAIVHGGFEVTHPMHDEALDKRVQDSFVRISNATDFGFAFLFAAIQKTILSGWKFPRFNETVTGEMR